MNENLKTKSSICEADRHLVLYAKGYYKRNESVSLDLKVLLGERSSISPEHITECDIMVVLGELVYPYLTQHNFLKIIGDASPTSLSRSLSRKYFPNGKAYNYLDAVIEAMLSILHFLSREQVGIHLGDPDPNLLPLSENFKTKLKSEADLEIKTTLEEVLSNVLTDLMQLESSMSIEISSGKYPYTVSDDEDFDSYTGANLYDQIRKMWKNYLNGEYVPEHTLVSSPLLDQIVLFEEWIQDNDDYSLEISIDEKGNETFISYLKKHGVLKRSLIADENGLSLAKNLAQLFEEETKSLEKEKEPKEDPNPVSNEITLDRFLQDFSDYLVRTDTSLKVSISPHFEGYKVVATSDGASFEYEGVDLFRYLQDIFEGIVQEPIPFYKLTPSPLLQKIQEIKMLATLRTGIYLFEIEKDNNCDELFHVQYHRDLNSSRYKRVSLSNLVNDLTNLFEGEI